MSTRHEQENQRPSVDTCAMLPALGLLSLSDRPVPLMAVPQTQEVGGDADKRKLADIQEFPLKQFFRKENRNFKIRNDFLAEAVEVRVLKYLLQCLCDHTKVAIVVYSRSREHYDPEEVDLYFNSLRNIIYLAESYPDGSNTHDRFLIGDLFDGNDDVPETEDEGLVAIREFRNLILFFVQWIVNQLFEETEDRSDISNFSDTHNLFYPPSDAESQAHATTDEIVISRLSKVAKDLGVHMVRLWDEIKDHRLTDIAGNRLTRSWSNISSDDKTKPIMQFINFEFTNRNAILSSSEISQKSKDYKVNFLSVLSRHFPFGYIEKPTCLYFPRVWFVH